MSSPKDRQDNAAGNPEESAEDRLIAQHFKPLATHPGAFGLGDDAAALAPPSGCDLVLTTDGVIAGVHFFPDDPADLVARRVLRMNLSDLAAKGAKPIGFLLSIALPVSLPENWLAGFCQGLNQDLKQFDWSLLGGDTDRTPGPLSVSVTAFGAVPAGRMVRRDGARAGHALYVSGTIGDASLGLALRRDAGMAQRWGLSAAHREHLLARYRVPEPRTALSAALVRYASAAMDVSDGLAGDLAKLCRASGVGVTIAAADVPISAAAGAALAADPSLLATMLSGGDDYEILAAVSTADAANFERAAKFAGVAVTRIGTLIADRAVVFRDRTGASLSFQRRSYSHF